ncbi:MAG TPA: LysR family transcriptional regulator [Tepidisphaeraceae bacterium]|jgi:DNA-binding transcriptional LysR family regulator
MNLNHLAIFHAVAAERNVSRGARRLMISQPAASKQLLQLERNLGVKLFDRVPRGVRLTEAGEMLARYAARLFAIEAEAESAIQELRGLRRGRLRLGASTTLGVYLLPDIFVRFRRTYPDIYASLEVIGSAAVERRLLEGDLDLGFVESFSGDERLEAVAFHTDELVPIAPPGHPLARKRRVTPEQFCNEPFVVRDTGSETKSFVERALASKGIVVQPVMSLGTTEAIKRAVASGIGVAIVSKLSIGLELEARRLSVLRISGLSVRRPLYHIVRKGAERSAATAEFLKML